MIEKNGCFVKIFYTFLPSKTGLIFKKNFCVYVCAIFGEDCIRLIILRLNVRCIKTLSQKAS